MTSQSEIRNSILTSLLDKVRNHKYGQYLYKANISQLRGFKKQSIQFDFPVTAIIGPNGSGKSAALGAAGCAYKSIKPSTFFPKSAVGDESMAGWSIDYELIDKSINPKQTIKRSSHFRKAKWVRGDVLNRNVFYFGIERTVPAGEKTKYQKLRRSTYQHKKPLSSLPSEVITQVEHILGKDIAKYQMTEYGTNDSFLVGSTDTEKYSEFHFGAGESSIIRMIIQIEQAPENSLVLIEEIENGLHPVATKRIVEYLIDVSSRKSIQTIFTTHSDHALAPLPADAIWACIDNKLEQGKLSVDSLRAVSGQIDKKIIIFVEDEFAKAWVDAILREKLKTDYEQVEVHSVQGDGRAVSIHNSHSQNPSIKSKSICIIDGDSLQKEDAESKVIRLPGNDPETTVFEDVISNLEQNLAVLTVSCQRHPDSQSSVESAIREVSKTNRDPHLIFNQIGIKIGFTSEIIVRGAFLAIWMRQNDRFCDDLAQTVRNTLQEMNKPSL